MFLTTHYMEEAERLCDRVLIIDHGRIVALDTPEALIRSLGVERRLVFKLPDGQAAPSLADLPRCRKSSRPARAWWSMARASASSVRLSTRWRMRVSISWIYALNSRIWKTSSWLSPAGRCGSSKMRGLRQLLAANLRLYLREPVATFFTLAFPPMLVLLFGAVYGNQPSDLLGGRGAMDVSMPGYTALILGSVGFMGVPITLSNYRETGVLRRFRLPVCLPQRTSWPMCW